LGGSNELSIDASSLAPGPHVITVTATDSAGNQSQTNVAITVQQLLPLPLSATVAGDQVELSWPDWDSTIAVWATFSLDSPTWFLVEGVPTDNGTNLTLTLQAPILEDALYYELAPP
jgi:hypothetical protein